MKMLLILALVLTLAEGSLAQDDPWNAPGPSDFPQIRKEAPTPTEFIPAKWKTIARSYGDLNGDGISDAVLVIKGNLSKFFYKDSFRGDPFDTNPRVLLILFKKRKGGYELGEFSNTFIIPPDNPSMAEPFESISIRKGVLILKFEEWYNAGSWYTAERTYRFKYLGTEFNLIGADKTESERNKGVVETRSYNFLTKRLKTTISNYDQRIRPKSTWRRFDIDKLMTFKTFPKPFEWQIEHDYYL